MTDQTMTDEGTTTSKTPDGVIPRRTDQRGMLHMLHDELGKALGLTGAKALPTGTTNGGAMQAMDQGIADAAGASKDY